MNQTSHPIGQSPVSQDLSIRTHYRDMRLIGSLLVIVFSLTLGETFRIPNLFGQAWDAIGNIVDSSDRQAEVT